MTSRAYGSGLKKSGKLFRKNEKQKKYPSLLHMGDWWGVTVCLSYPLSGNHTLKTKRWGGGGGIHKKIQKGQKVNVSDRE